VFVNRCQNLRDRNSGAESEDGGFFFTPGDPFRNKAGLQIQAAGPPRFRSYGSATADGLRCLQACAKYADAERKKKALQWLDAHLSTGRMLKNHGTFAADRLKDRDAAMFYFAASFAAVQGSNGMKEALNGLRDELVRKQLDDGSWRNELNAVREDDPLLATALALLSLR
jgi:hypothetical protein